MSFFRCTKILGEAGQQEKKKKNKKNLLSGRVRASRTVNFFFLLSHRKYHKPTANYILSTADNPEPVR